MTKYIPITYYNSKSSSNTYTSSVPSQVLSSVEQSIYSSNRPVSVSGNKVITVNGETGLWANQYEVESWRGEVPLSQYTINQDSNPTIVRKQRDYCEDYEQNVSVRYLKPPQPQPHGDLVIKEQPNIPTGPAPPIVIRQEPPRPVTPPALVLREAPPKPPAPLPSQQVSIPGKRLTPPPRKVVIEKLPRLPEKPQNVVIERWLPYEKQTRRVIFEKNTVPDPVVPAPKNVIVQWETPCVNITKTFTDLGVVNADPEAYVRQYGSTLKTSSEIRAFAGDVKVPAGIKLAAESVSSTEHELVGDIHALSLIDLDSEGLGEYKKYLSGAQSSRIVSTSSAVYDSVVPSSTVTSSVTYDASSYQYQTVPDYISYYTF